jgi:ADP-heptose:LPS heptosyltransferase
MLSIPENALVSRAEPVCGRPPAHDPTEQLTTKRVRPPVLLVLRSTGLGGFLTAVPAYRALADAFPDHKRVLAAPLSLRSIARLSGFFDELLPLKPLTRLPAMRHPDMAVNLQGCAPDANRILQAVRPRRLISFRRDPATGPRWRAAEHDVERWCRLLEHHGVRANPFRLDLPRPLALPHGVRGATIIHPGAAHGARRWPPDRWTAVARSERARGRRVIVTGDVGERSLAGAIARAAGIPPADVLAGKTSLRGLTALVSAAGRVACGDTGMAHLATAMGTPSVVLFGPTSPYEWGPPAHRPWHRVLWHGRRGDPEATSPDSGLLAISVDEVVDAIGQLPPGAPARDDRIRRSA